MCGRAEQLHKNSTAGKRQPIDKRHTHTNKQMLASAIVPGLGQWMQGRRGTALIFFLVFATYMLAATIPLIWTLWGHRSEVSIFMVVIGLLMPFIIAAIAAWDCWNMRGS